MNILIVDDEPLVRRALEKAFQVRGWTVFTAEDGSIGMSRWKTHIPDVVLLDVLMPIMSGPQLLEAMDGQWTCKIILMSAYTGEEMKNIQERFKIDLFLSKPFENVFEVVEKIEQLLGK